MEENNPNRLPQTQPEHPTQSYNNRNLSNGLNGRIGTTGHTANTKPQQGSSSSSSSSDHVNGSLGLYVTNTQSDHAEEYCHQFRPVDNNYKGSVMTKDSRKCTMRQWNAPPFTWGDMETTSVRKLFHVSQSKAMKKLADVKDRFMDAAAFSDADEDEKMAERKVVAVVLAFQRWRHTQLKNIFSQELKKVLEEAREDEACLAALETELESSEQHLAMALTESAQLRSQLQITTNSNYHEERLSGDSCMKDLMDKKMLRVIEGLSAAEAEVHRRDNEIRHLKERLKSIEEQGGRIDGQLHANISLLQAEKMGALEENRVLLEQLARRDEERVMQGEELERLKAIVARLAERQSVDQQHIDSLKTEHNAEIQSLQEQLRQAFGAKCSKEMELASYTERCSGLGQERENLMMQLHHAVERANLASCRAEELQMKLHYTAEDRAKASEEVALEMVKHLKRLTDHMRELESTVSTTNTPDLQPNGTKSRMGALRPGSKMGINGVKGATPEPEHVNAESIELDDYQMCPENKHPQKRVFFSPMLEQRAFKPRLGDHYFEQHRDMEDLKKWTTWKWRWAASSARAEQLAKQLHEMEVTKSRGSRTIQKQDKAEDLIQRLKSGNLTTCVEKELNFMLTEHKLVPLILSAWRAFARTCVLEKKAISRNASLDKMMEALPWWIRRVGERRHLERNFFHWQLLTLRANRQPKLLKGSTKKQSVEVVPSQAVELARPTLPPTSRSLESKPHVEHNAPVVPARLGCIQQRRHSSCNADAGAGAAAGSLKRNLGEGGRVSGVVSWRVGKDNHPKPINGMGSTSRALQALQTSLQQEVNELQNILSQEIRALQIFLRAKDSLKMPCSLEGRCKFSIVEEVSRHTLFPTISEHIRCLVRSGAAHLCTAQFELQSDGRSIVEPLRASLEDQRGPDQKWALKSVCAVCNNLAMALTDVRSKLCTQGGGVNKVISKNLNEWRKLSRELPTIALKIQNGRPNTRSPRKSPHRGRVHVHLSPSRLVRPRILHHTYPWVGGGIRVASPNQRMRCHAPPADRETQYSSQHVDERRMHHPSPSRVPGRGRYASPTTVEAKTHHSAGEEGIRSPQYSPSTARKQLPQSGRPSSQKLCSRHESPAQVQKPAVQSKPKACGKIGTKESNPPQSTVVEITPNGENCSEIAIHTEPVQEMESLNGAACEEKNMGVPATNGRGNANKKLVVNRAALASMKKKNCVGTAYANLLSAEISRLRQGRHTTEFV